MSTEKVLIDAEEGVQLWKTDLMHEGGVTETAYFVRTLRTPESDSFTDEAQARKAYEREVELSKNSDFVQRRLGGVKMAP